MSTMSNSSIRQLAHNELGHLTLVLNDGSVHTRVLPVRAHPLSAPDEGLSLMNAEGHEVAWIERLSTLPETIRKTLETELAVREFTPVIQALRAVSSFNTPCTWTVDTDRGPTLLELKSEDAIRRLGDGRLLIHTAAGLNFGIQNLDALDAHSRKLLNRFL